MTIERKAPTGILGFPVAPFTNEGNIDEKVLEKNINFLVEEGLTSIFVACGAGEFQSINQKEYQKMVEIAVSTVNGKVPVYTGVGGNLSQALEQTELSAKLGADGYLVLPPYLIEGEQEGIFNYLKTVVNSTDLNAILYQRDNCIASLETVTKLAEYPQVVGVKDGAGNMELNMELIQNLGDRLEWVNGMPLAEVTMPAFYHIGFNSYSSAISNYIPHVSRLFFNALQNGDQQLLNDLYQDVIFPINNIRKQRKGYAVSLIKAGMDIVGLPVTDVVRPPVVPVEKEHYQQLEKILKGVMDKYPNDKKVTL
ncbi:5-dehydro-4-deoxyglucarate dehydratase [Desertibacillus haloalkaliphilus]|uniref:5-dehydro-4-deoxyglucarate dehydratase n=1 Tax=Desertibacillus haloalkaliphilus TaxID=1328930 RepID=UPI001C279FA6|nr:5-dehydro-4-deoxyglucarate dehydratase [Desertibacillus haloalkaliphilus]MBU8906468.1 5-dehydro-4-deoxyglucarate dehydratase [Desertibacillus haloalkaliphilus]